MKNLLPHEIAQIEAEMTEYVQNLALLDIKCVVVVDGRGLFHVGYGKETQPSAVPMLADAYHAVKKHNARSVN